jgi:hypothetical protein
VCGACFLAVWLAGSQLASPLGWDNRGSAGASWCTLHLPLSNCRCKSADIVLPVCCSVGQCVACCSCWQANFCWPCLSCWEVDLFEHRSGACVRAGSDCRGNFRRVAVGNQCWGCGLVVAWVAGLRWNGWEMVGVLGRLSRRMALMLWLNG